MASKHHFVFPAEPIPPSCVSSDPKKSLKLGPGLRHAPPRTIIATAAGKVQTNKKKNQIWVDGLDGHYTPSVGDRVIGVVLRTTMDEFQVLLADHSAPAVLPHLSFEGVSKKTRPMLGRGALVYARVASADPHMDAGLECVSSDTGRAEGLGPLARGAGTMLFGVSPGMARRLLMARSVEDGGLAVLDECEQAGLAFETVTGRNGRLWVNGGAGGDDGRGGKVSARTAMQTALVVGRAIQETDEKGLGLDEQRKLVRRCIASIFKR